MTKSLLFLLSFCCLTISLAAEQSSTAVVELFTSEGCSSCPRADVLLGELSARSWPAGEVYGLAFHVNYWDRLGWKDRFSSKRFSDRQRHYAETLPDHRVYTPQMIVDGQHGFVGSDRDKAVRAIESTLRVKDQIDITLTVDAVGGGTARLSYTLATPAEGNDINEALAQRLVTTDVKHGENVGRLLRHSHVVRAFKRFSAGENLSGKTKLRLPEDVEVEGLDAIIYIQDRSSLAILGKRVTLKGDI
jgi:hypothetical protein